MVEPLHMPICNPFTMDSGYSQKGKGLEKREEIQSHIHLVQKLPYKILLLDDMYTTGNTMKGALKEIDVSKHKIRIYTLAHRESV